MSISTNISFHNANDPKFIAQTSTFSGLEKWEANHGPVAEYPGTRIDGEDAAVEETGAEYGGWVIDLSKIPPDVTHIAIIRS